MRTSKPTRHATTSLALLSCAVLLACVLLGQGAAFADDPPPPPPPPETPTFTPSPTYTFTPMPPTSTFTPPPSSSPTPTHTSTPTRTPTAVQPPPGPQPTTGPSPKPQPNPNCLSAVQGNVLGAAGQRVAGATVIIEGNGWSSAIMSDDNGHYGFGGLCAGTATLTAYLPDGQVSQPVRVTLNGQDSASAVLSLLSAGVSTATRAPTPEPTSTPAVEMPVTGYSGWLMVGGALLGGLSLLSAGARRAWRVRDRTQDNG
jgi:hypothetical protein